MSPSTTCSADDDAQAAVRGRRWRSRRVGRRGLPRALPSDDPAIRREGGAEGKEKRSERDGCLTTAAADLPLSWRPGATAGHDGTTQGHRKRSCLTRSVHRFLKSDDGATTAEYAILLA